MLGKLVSPFLALFRRSELDRELDEELRFHLEREVEENIRRGMSPEGARRTAMVSTTGTPSSRASAAVSIAMPRFRATSVMLSASTSGTPMRPTSSTMR